MKAYKQGDKIIIKSNDDYQEMERLINRIVRDLDTIKSKCEDRNTETFPIEAVKRIVESSELLKTKGKDIFIHREFVENIMETKDVYKYFQDVIEKAKKEEEKYLKKLEYFKKFAQNLANTFQ